MRQEVIYAVEPDGSEPYLLARLRWPDICDVMSEAKPVWKPGSRNLFNMLYSSDGAWVTKSDAAKIAERWGGSID